MENRLSFVSIHKSITGFKDVVLPGFVVLTGKNGSGKSHLLNALIQGKVRSSLVQNPQTDVLLFDSQTIAPHDTGVFDPAQHQIQKSGWFQFLQSKREELLPQLQQIVIGHGIPASACSSIAAIKSLDKKRITELLPSETNTEAVAAAIQQALANAGSSIFQQSTYQIGDEYWKKAAAKVHEKSAAKFLTASHSDFFDDEYFRWGTVDPFQQAFGRLFTTYRELIHENDRLEKYAHLTDGKKALLTEQFSNLHGTPPWEFVNKILEECTLDFRVETPPLHEIAPYEPKLYKVSNSVEMRFQDLSSGEKVLMSFALCLYNAQDIRQAKNFPKLLLLDEVDAPLHPSMTASLLRTIQNVLIRDKNVAVILATHSPSTVALAPDDAIFIMNPNGPSIEKISKSGALSLLTAGVPTLSVSFDGRRQIFVESRTDANLYDLLYQKYKSHLGSERSLVFIEVGNKNNSGLEQNAGCEQVIRMVEGLSAAGNRSVLGLIDWDGKRTAANRLHVLSPSIRDGIESLLFDPVLLVAVIARENTRYAREKTILDSEETYVSLSHWDNERWQQAVTIAQNIILQSTNTVRENINVDYVNGMSLKIAKDYLHIDDHVLESRVLTHFAFLRQKNGHAGDLMRHVAETVLSENPGLLPKDLLVTFSSLLQDDF